VLVVVVADGLLWVVVLARVAVPVSGAGGGGCASAGDTTVPASCGSAGGGPVWEGPVVDDGNGADGGDGDGDEGDEGDDGNDAGAAKEDDIT